jgi:Transglutaminase-like superfamily
LIADRPLWHLINDFLPIVRNSLVWQFVTGTEIVELNEVLIMRLISRYKNLNPAERHLFFRALALLVVTRVGLRMLPFRIVRNWTEHFHNSNGLHSVMDRRSIGRVAWAVEAASRRLPGTTCLPRAIVTYILLGRLGQTSELRLGAALKPQGSFEAHAWVEVSGRVVIGEAIEGFHRFMPFQESTFLLKGFK